MAHQENQHTEIAIPFNESALMGDLTIPPHASAIIIFVHGSGSSRFSSRNRYVAGKLQEAGMATLLMDLLTPTEEEIDRRTGEFRFDIPLLAERALESARWTKKNPTTRHLPIGYFGASTGAAAALMAAARDPADVFAVVSRGGRPDLAVDFLPSVQAPTLLIVGSEDDPVIGMNEEAARHLKVPHQVVLIPGATHLFEEEGALERVARLAADWYVACLKERQAGVFV